MGGKMEVSDENMSKIITSAVLLQLTQEVRDDLIGKAISEWLLAPASNYDKQTRLHKQVYEAVDRAVKTIFDQLLSEEPYRERLRHLANAKLTALFEDADGELEKLVAGIIETAVRNAQAKR